MRPGAFIALLAVVLSIICGGSAHATDCSKASSNIERALCSAALRNADSQLNGIFADMHAYLPDDKATILLSDQRSWLKKRDATCIAAADNQLIACLKKATDDRTNDLLDHFEQDHPLKTVDGGFTLSGHNLLFDGRTITEDGKTIFQNAWDGGSVVISDGFHTKELDAVAVLAFDGGTLGCASDIVLVSRHNSAIQVFNGDGSDECTSDVKLTPDGFRFTGDVDEVEGRTDELWSIKDGKFKDEKITFKPAPGTKLSDMVNNPPMSPLDNEEFFQITSNLGSGILSPDSNLAKTVLQYAMSVKSVSVPDYIVFEGCNTSIRDACANGGGRYVRIENGFETVNGFIAISLSTKKAFYALDSLPQGMDFYPNEVCEGLHSVAIFPEKHDWPSELLKQLDDWIANRDCG